MYWGSTGWYWGSIGVVRGGTRGCIGVVRGGTGGVLVWYGVVLGDVLG